MSRIALSIPPDLPALQASAFVGKLQSRTKRGVKIVFFRGAGGRSVSLGSLRENQCLRGNGATCVSLTRVNGDQLVPYKTRLASILSTNGCLVAIIVSADHV
jgi:hypothetical protein